MPEPQKSIAEMVLEDIYGHIADRVAQHYHLPLTPHMWADWNAAIHHRTKDAMFVLLRQDGVTFWRVWHGQTPVFVLYRDGLIRTALSVTGSFYLDAQEEARKIGQTALGNPLKPVVPERSHFVKLRARENERVTRIAFEMAQERLEKEAVIAAEAKLLHETPAREQWEKLEANRAWENEGGCVKLVAKLRSQGHRMLDENDELL